MAYTQNPYAYTNPTSYFPGAPPFETEEQKKKKKEEEQKAILERIQTNRLYLKKVKKECALESFENLQKLHLFLFEVMIEALEVNGESVLNLVTDNKDLTFVTARVRFLNSPYLEICEKDIVLEDQKTTDVQSEYLKTVSEGGLANTYYTGSPPPTPTPPVVTHAWTPSPPPPPLEPVFGPSTEQEFMEKMKVKWNKTSGKSCMFSLTPLQVVQDLETYPVVVQVVRRLLADTQQGKVTDKDKLTDKDKMADVKLTDKTEKDKDVDKTKMSNKEEEVEKIEPLGYARIKLPDVFSLSILQSCKEGVILPVSNVHRENCDLENVFGTKKGTISVYIRLSSFGPAIITNFHTVGNQTRYVYKPSSVKDNFQQVRKITATDELKPLLAEEDKAVGISVLKTEDDTFKKPVMWRSGKLDCGCTFEGECFYPSDPSSLYTEMTPMQLPASSQLSLCRDAIQPKDLKNFNKFKTLGKTCIWHTLVTNEIQNAPGETCGCIPCTRKEVEKVQPKGPAVMVKRPCGCIASTKKVVEKDRDEGAKRTCGCILSTNKDIEKDSKDPDGTVKRKPRGICTCSPPSDLQLYLQGDGKPKLVDPHLKKTHLGLCNCIPGMANKPDGLQKKVENKKSCCDCCKCCSSKKRPKKKTSSTEKILFGYCGWPSLRSFVKKDPYGWDDQESKKLNKLLENADKLVGDELKNKPKVKKRNCGCIPTDKSKTPPKKGKSKKEKCECKCKQPKGLLKPESSSDYSSSDSADRPLNKMIPLGKDLPPIPGFGIKPTKSDCGCECPEIKKALKDKTLFPL